MDYHVIDRDMGQTPGALMARLNVIGLSGWWLVQNYVTRFQQRRTIFKQVGGVVEYLVDDRNTGRPAQEVEDALDGFGADGWELVALDLVMQNKRRAIYARGGASGGGDGGGISEAPVDDFTYGRRNTTWNRAIAYDNDTIDGGDF